MSSICHVCHEPSWIQLGKDIDGAPSYIGIGPMEPDLSLPPESEEDIATTSSVRSGLILEAQLKKFEKTANMRMIGGGNVKKGILNGGNNMLFNMPGTRKMGLGAKTLTTVQLFKLYGR